MRGKPGPGRQHGDSPGREGGAVPPAAGGQPRGESPGGQRGGQPWPERRGRSPGGGQPRGESPGGQRGAIQESGPEGGPSFPDGGRTAARGKPGRAARGQSRPGRWGAPPGDGQRGAALAGKVGCPTRRRAACNAGKALAGKVGCPPAAGNHGRPRPPKTRSKKGPAGPVLFLSGNAQAQSSCLGMLELKRSSARAATMPTARQTTLTTTEPTEVKKLSTGMIMMVAAMTMPMMAWKA